jgi:hypothetical protein
LAASDFTGRADLTVGLAADFAAGFFAALGAAGFALRADFAAGFFGAAGFEDLLRVCLDIRLPFDAFAGSNILIATGNATLPLLGKSVSLGVWLQGFGGPTIPVC